MGVPALFRWLSKKYPKIITPVVEEEPTILNDVVIPPQYSNPNPNGELDNLYLDMNGIVHPCSHPENKPPPETEDEMLLAVFEYTDRVVNMARPRKILMIAVDGVAPRAKMNQQRARRFRSARDAAIQNEERERMINMREDYGEVIDEAVKSKKTWDSNAITPGTPFMDKLALALRYWTAYKLSTDPGWKNVQVIISDATVPGEGEHKIMNFIRSQRSDIEYNPNTTHAIYGLDADLIFLGLATHEPHFRVLREDVFAQDRKSLSFQQQMNLSEQEKKLLQEKESKKPFLWLNINVLREYLQIELNLPKLSFKFDLERAIDDWVFLCFFCGNDFLPHLPSLEVRNNSIDLLVKIWKQSLPKMKSYITCDGKLNLENVEILLSNLAPREEQIFKERKMHADREANKRNKYGGNNNNDRKQAKATLANPVFNLEDYTASKEVSNKKLFELKDTIALAQTGDLNAIEELKQKLSNEDVKVNENAPAVTNQANISAAAAIKQQLLARSNAVKSEDAQIGDKRLASEDPDADEDQAELEDEDEEDEEDVSEVPTSGVYDSATDVKLWEPGYHDRYYTIKFHCKKSEVDDLKRQVVKHYIEGISWVLLYYYQGCPSWEWYYPYHYAPFAADFTDLSSLEIKFVKGEPFLPFEQLMSVLPAASGHNLPEIFRPLMSEETSPIIDFYPAEFPIDMNGSHLAWQGIVLLPFIDAPRLLKNVREQYTKLTEDEKARNVRKDDILFISNQNKNYDEFVKIYKDDSIQTIDFHHSKSGLSGRVFANSKYKLDDILPCPIKGEHSYPDLPTSPFLKLNYEIPKKLTNGKSIILTGYIQHQPVLTQEDKDSIVYGGGGGYGRNRYNKNFNTQDQNLIKTGPGSKYCYTPRAGGYKAFLLSFKQKQQGQHNQYYNNNSNYNNYNNNYNNYNNNYNSHNNYNNSYNNHNNYNNGYNNHNNYNNGYNRNNYNNNNRNYGNLPQPSSRSQYLPPQNNNNRNGYSRR